MTSSCLSLEAGKTYQNFWKLLGNHSNVSASILTKYSQQLREIKSNVLWLGDECERIFLKSFFYLKKNFFFQPIIKDRSNRYLEHTSNKLISRQKYVMQILRVSDLCTTLRASTFFLHSTAVMHSSVVVSRVRLSVLSLLISKKI